MDAKQLREEGNALFKDGKFEEALSLYTKAINISPLKESEKSAIYKNKAACELKLERYSEAVEDASKGSWLTQWIFSKIQSCLDVEICLNS